MRYVIERGWQKIDESSGLMQNVSERAFIEISNSEDNGGLILFPGQKLAFTRSFYARKHMGGGPCVLAIMEGNGAIPVTISGGGSGGGSGSSGGDSPSAATDDDIDCIFETHSEHMNGG